MATSRKSEDDRLSNFVKSLGYDVFRGSENNVLNRYYNAAIKYESEIVVRITGDCPILDPSLVDKVIYSYNSENADYASNIDPPSYPDGLDVEVFSFDSLQEANEKAKLILKKSMLRLILEKALILKNLTY